MSGRKNSLPKYQIISAGDASGTLISKITNIQYMDNLGIQVNVTSGTPSGTLNVQISADHFEVNQDVTVAGTFISLGGTYQVTVTAGSPSNVYFDITEISAPYIQLRWDHTGGTGTIDAFIVGKMI